MAKDFLDFTSPHVSVGKTGMTVFISKIIKTEKNNRIFGKVSIIKLDNPIKLGNNISFEGKKITPPVRRIYVSSNKKNKIFEISTENKAAYEIGVLTNS